jgi:hypothetical protein
MTSPSPVPDLLAALRSGTYSHAFARALTGPLSTTAGSQRAAALDTLLEREDGAAALTSLLLLGGRRLLDDLARAGSNAEARAATALATATSGDLDDYAVNPGDLFRPQP